MTKRNLDKKSTAQKRALGNEHWKNIICISLQSARLVHSWAQFLSLGFQSDRNVATWSTIFIKTEKNEGFEKIANEFIGNNEKRATRSLTSHCVSIYFCVFAQLGKVKENFRDCTTHRILLFFYTLSAK